MDNNIGIRPVGITVTSIVMYYCMQQERELEVSKASFVSIQYCTLCCVADQGTSQYSPGSWNRGNFTVCMHAEVSSFQRVKIESFQ